jgi:VWFA-related protein
MRESERTPSFRAPSILATAAFASCCIVYGQSAPVAPSEPPSAQTPNGVTTLRVGTHLVVLDVSVLDWKGSPVTGLQKDAFHLLEDGQEQKIKSFEEHAPIPAVEARELLAAAAAKLPPNTFTNFKPFPGGTVNVVVMDSLTSRPDTQNFFLNQISLYLSQIPPRHSIHLSPPRLPTSHGAGDDHGSRRHALCTHIESPRAVCRNRSDLHTEA